MKKKILEVALHEHTTINKKIDDFISAQFIYITTILTFASSFIYVAYESKQEDSSYYEYVQFLPYLFIIIAPVFMFKFNRTVILHGYRYAIEERINMLIGKNVKIGGYLTKEKLLNTNPFSISIFITIALAIGISIVYCHRFQEHFWNFNFFIQAIILIIGSTAFIIINNKAFMKGYNFAVLLYDKDHALLKRSTKKKT